MKINFSTAIILTFLTVIAASCSESGAKADLEKQTEELDSTCPISIGIAGDLVSAEYDMSDNALTLSYAFAPMIADIDVIERHKKDFVNMLKIIYSNESMSDFIKLVDKAECSFKIVIKVKGDVKAAELMMTRDDIREITDLKMSEIEKSDIFLGFTEMITNARTPMQVDEATLLTNVKLNDTAFVYYYEVDDGMIDMEQLRQLAPSLKGHVAQMFSDPAMKQLIDNLVTVGKGLTYSYTDKEASDSTMMSYSVDELRMYCDL